MSFPLIAMETQPTLAFSAPDGVERQERPTMDSAEGWDQDEASEVPRA